MPYHKICIANSGLAGTKKRYVYVFIIDPLRSKQMEQMVHIAQCLFESQDL